MTAAILAAYLIGSVPFALILARRWGADLRRVGSGNLGAANVLRASGVTAGVLVALLDVMKGAFSVAIAFRMSDGAAVPAAAGFAAIVGHIYPVWLRFRGGKGVATAAGVLLALQPWLGVACLATWLLVALVTRYSSLAAVVTAVLAPIVDVVFWGPTARTDAVAVMSLLLVWRHRANIGKLLAGTESKIGSRAKRTDPSSNDSPEDPSP